MEAMTNTADRGRDLVVFIDLLVDDLSLTSDEELVAGAIEQYGSLRAALGDLDAEIEAAISSAGKERLAKARANIVDDAEKNRSARSIDPTEVQKQLADFVASHKTFAKMTLAARNGKGSAQNDILSALTDLCELRQLNESTPLPDFGSVPKAEYILKHLGIETPDDIDVEAIARHLGARVRYDQLSQCEARIVGDQDAAIITIDRSVSLQRQRFSICHELGHWIYHRGQLLSCQADDIELPSADSNNLERAADRFASELLMPSYLFAPIAESLGPPSMRVIQKLSEVFRTSKTATAIRLVEINQRPLCLVNHSKNGRRWFARSKTVASRWTPNYELRSENTAFGMIFGKSPSALPPRSVSASAWFDRRDASRFNVIENSLRIAPSEVITLLAFKEQKEFLAYSE